MSSAQRKCQYFKASMLLRNADLRISNQYWVELLHRQTQFGVEKLEEHDIDETLNY